MEKIPLLIEKAPDGKLWGRVEFEDNLMVDSANSLEALEFKMKKLLLDFHQIDPLEIRFQTVFRKGIIAPELFGSSYPLNRAPAMRLPIPCNPLSRLLAQQ